MDILIAIIGGGVGAAVVTVVGQLLTARQMRRYAREDKRDALADEVRGLREDVDALRESIDKRDAVQARTHILRFDDELRNKIKHSQEYFRQILDDADTYDEFCAGHPGFRNGYATAAEKHIREVYDQCLAENSFV